MASEITIQKRREYARTYYVKHKDEDSFKQRIREYHKRYFQENKERISEQRRKYYRDNIEKVKEYNRNYYRDNIEKVKEYNRNYYRDNIEKVKEYNRNYYREHVQGKKDYAKRWREANPQKIKEYNLKRAVLRRKKKPKVLKPTEQVARIFKNPATAEHFKWIMRNRGLDNSNNNNEQLKESEVEHEKVE